MVIRIRASFRLAPPSLRDLSERGRIEVMELVAAFSPRNYEAGCLKDVEVLGDRLTRRAEAMVGEQPDAQFEQCLAAAVVEFVEDGPPCRVGQCPVDVAHAKTIGKYLLACQVKAGVLCVTPGW